MAHLQIVRTGQPQRLPVQKAATPATPQETKFFLTNMNYDGHKFQFFFDPETGNLTATVSPKGKVNQVENVFVHNHLAKSPKPKPHTWKAELQTRVPIYTFHAKEKIATIWFSTPPGGCCAAQMEAPTGLLQRALEAAAARTESESKDVNSSGQSTPARKDSSRSLATTEGGDSRSGSRSHSDVDLGSPSERSSQNGSSPGTPKDLTPEKLTPPKLPTDGKPLATMESARVLFEDVTYDETTRRLVPTADYDRMHGRPVSGMAGQSLVVGPHTLPGLRSTADLTPKAGVMGQQQQQQQSRREVKQTVPIVVFPFETLIGKSEYTNMDASVTDHTKRLADALQAKQWDQVFAHCQWLTLSAFCVDKLSDPLSVAATVLDAVGAKGTYSEGIPKHVKHVVLNLLGPFLLAAHIKSKTESYAFSAKTIGTLTENVAAIEKLEDRSSDPLSPTIVSWAKIIQVLLKAFKDDTAAHLVQATVGVFRMLASAAVSGVPDPSGLADVIKGLTGWVGDKLDATARESVVQVLPFQYGVLVYPPALKTLQDNAEKYTSNWGGACAMAQTFRFLLNMSADPAVADCIYFGPTASETKTPPKYGTLPEYVTFNRNWRKNALVQAEGVTALIVASTSINEKVAMAAKQLLFALDRTATNPQVKAILAGSDKVRATFALMKQNWPLHKSGVEGMLEFVMAQLTAGFTNLSQELRDTQAEDREGRAYLEAQLANLQRSVASIPGSLDALGREVALTSKLTAQISGQVTDLGKQMTQTLERLDKRMEAGFAGVSDQVAEFKEHTFAKLDSIQAQLEAASASSKDHPSVGALIERIQTNLTAKLARLQLQKDGICSNRGAYPAFIRIDTKEGIELRWTETQTAKMIKFFVNFAKRSIYGDGKRLTTEAEAEAFKQKLARIGELIDLRKVRIYDGF